METWRMRRIKFRFQQKQIITRILIEWKPVKIHGILSPAQSADIGVGNHCQERVMAPLTHEFFTIEATKNWHWVSLASKTSPEKFPAYTLALWATYQAVFGANTEF